MKYLFLVILAFVFSCGIDRNQMENNFFKEVKFSIDTVIIDPGDEIIFTQHDLFGSDLSPNGKFLYNFNLNDHTLEKINLDDLRLEEKIQFEKEGPNGTGSFIGKIKLTGNGELFVNNMTHSTLFTLEGLKIKKVFFENFYEGSLPSPEFEELRFTKIFDESKNQFYSLIFKTQENSLLFGVFLLDDFSIKKFYIESIIGLDKFIFELASDYGSILNFPEVDFVSVNSKVIVYNQNNSSLWWYDVELDSVFNKKYSSNITSNGKNKEYKLKHNSEESFNLELDRYLEEINFMGLIWDENNEIFYRFSYELISSEENAFEFKKAKVYLTAYDKDLNQIGETIVPDLIKKPQKHFAKDGKIWIYENLNDELAFVRFSIHKDIPNK